MNSGRNNLDRKLTGISLAAGPLLMAVSTFLWEDGKYGATGGMILALALVPWIHGLIGVLGILRPRMPTYATIALPVALYGAFGGAAFGYRDFFETAFEVGSNEISLDALAVYPLESNLLLFWPGPLFPLSLLALGGALIRTRLVPVWAGVVMCVGAAGFPVSRISREVSIAHLADVLLLVPFAYMGWLFWKGRLDYQESRQISAPSEQQG